ncbi:MAG TPA: hypothetical protein VFS43_08145 [Polyangiaceae bacterium]|nr:hypothetical protein [Polyangiaceae bacterium]
MKAPSEARAGGPMKHRAPLAAALVALALAAGCAKSPRPAAPPPQRHAPPAALLLAIEGRRVAHESLDAVRTAQRGLTKVLAVALRASAAVWLVSHDTCPSADELLASAHPTAAHASPTDAWEAPFRITCRDGDAEVRSAGPDGVFSTDDDVVASDRE